METFLVVSVYRAINKPAFADQRATFVEPLDPDIVEVHRAVHG